MSRSDEPLPPNWDAEEVRRDGFTIAEEGERWAIYDRGGVRRIDACPCCGKALRSLRAARRACDAMYPIAPGKRG